MDIPKEILGKNRIRDYAICMDYIRGKKSEEIIVSRKLTITVRRIEQILYKNREFVSSNIAWPKSQRIHNLQRWIADKESTKDPLEIQKELRAEIEGEHALIDQSQNTNITYVWKTEGNNNPLRGSELSERDSSGR